MVRCTLLPDSWPILLRGAHSHRSQLSGVFKDIRNPSNKTNPKCWWIPAGWSPSSLVIEHYGLPRCNFPWCLDWTRWPHSLACQVSRHHTSGLFLWGYIKDRVYKTPVHDMDHLKQKIREAVASVTPGMLAATWRELRSRLEFLRENNGDHVEVFFRWASFSYPE